MKFVLFCPLTKMYFCDEPYMEIRGKPVRPNGCAVKSRKDATPYATKGQAQAAQRKLAPEYPEIL